MAGLPLQKTSLRSQLAAAYRAACLSELEALKPGNVHRYSDGHRMTLDDFVTSAEVSAEPLTEPALGLGERIYRAVEATRAAVGCNTNLGILMLCAPLIQAMFEQPQSPASLRESLCTVLARTESEDVAWLYRAIRLAAPGGLGSCAKYDVSQTPDAPLLEVMAHAAQRDLIALQYTTGYADLFDFALPRLRRCEQQWGNGEWALSGLYLGLLARFPDTHIQRKHGLYKAVVITLRAAELAKGLAQAEKPEHYLFRLLQADNEFKREEINPGTSADLTVATLFLSHLESMLLPFDPKTGHSRAHDSQPHGVGIRN